MNFVIDLLNHFNNTYDLPTISGETITDFKVERNLLIRQHDERLTDLPKDLFDNIKMIDSTFETEYKKNKKNVAFMLILTNQLLKNILNDEYSLKAMKDHFQIIKNPVTIRKKDDKYVCSCSKCEPCFCGLGKYRTTEYNLVNFTGYGDKKWHGMFNFPDLKIVYEFTLTSQYAKKYAFVEQKTNYFKFFLDIDIKESNLTKDFIMSEKFTHLLKYVVDSADKIFKKHTTLTDDLTKYIYCDKNIDDSVCNPDINESANNKEKYNKGIHIYYPNIIVNKTCALNIANLLINHLKANDDLCLNEKQYRNIIDLSVYKGNGLRILFQEIDGYYYKINKELSTYEILTDDKLEQLKLTSLRTLNDKCNFEFV